MARILVAEDEWDSADLEQIGETVYIILDEEYSAKIWPAGLIHMLVTREWARGNMDYPTSRAIFYRVLSDIGDASAASYTVGDEPVREDIVTKVVEQELPYLQRRHKENSKLAVDALTQAFRDGPQRFNRAQTASTFQDYLTICRGEE